MSNTVIMNKRAGMNAKLRISDQFRHYKPEQEQRTLTVKVSKNKAVEQLKDAFVKYKPRDPQFEVYEYEDAIKLVKELEYSPKDVTNFSLALLPFQFQEEGDFSYKTGSFLSALINNCKGNEFTVITEHLSELPCILGGNNTKIITVKGGVGDFLGNDMKRGTIIVEGNADSNVGAMMTGGRIIIKGNVSSAVGNDMYGGSIHIHGDAGDIGDRMYGGSIHLHGNYKSISGRTFNSHEPISARIEKGKIYHKGKLIWEDGDKI